MRSYMSVILSKILLNIYFYIDNTDNNTKVHSDLTTTLRNVEVNILLLKRYGSILTLNTPYVMTWEENELNELIKIEMSRQSVIHQQHRDWELFENDFNVNDK